MNEGKNEKAEKVLDLGMEKMPVKYFEYYSLLEPFVLGYYELGKPEKARAIYEDVTTIFQEHLSYYSGMKVKRQYPIAEEIISDMERYRSLVDIAIVYDEEAFARAEAAKFNDYLKLFRHFYSPDENLDVDSKLEAEDSLPMLPDTIVEDGTEVGLE